jgi:hypothetical protein
MSCEQHAPAGVSLLFAAESAFFFAFTFLVNLSVWSAEKPAEQCCTACKEVGLAACYAAALNHSVSIQSECWGYMFSNEQQAAAGVHPGPAVWCWACVLLCVHFLGEPYSMAHAAHRVSRKPGSQVNTAWIIRKALHVAE